MFFNQNSFTFFSFSHFLTNPHTTATGPKAHVELSHVWEPWGNHLAATVGWSHHEHSTEAVTEHPTFEKRKEVAFTFLKIWRNQQWL